MLSLLYQILGCPDESALWIDLTCISCNISTIFSSPTKLIHTVISTLLQDLSLSGYRIGVICSWSPHLLDCIRPLCSFGACPNVVQKQMEILLSDLGKTIHPSIHPLNHPSSIYPSTHPSTHPSSH